MTFASFRAGRILASVLCLAPASLTLAAAAPFHLLRRASKTLTPAALTAAEKMQTPGKASPDGKTLTFTQKTVRLVVVTGPENDMLSYRIGGLRSPALGVPKGAALTLLFVNTDDDMAHDIRFGPALPSYPNVMAAYGKSAGTRELAHKSETVLHAEELTLHAPDLPGVYGYFCTVRGHAQGGMAGKVIVR